MRVWDRIQGLVTVELCAAFPERLLNACVQEGIPLLKPQRLDACTLRVQVQERDLEALRSLTERHQGQLKVLERFGGSQELIRLKRRVALPLGLLAVLALLFWSNSRIWAIEVRGCETLSQGRVLRALADCGVSEGSCWASLSQDEIRSQMLLALPELSWMTVNVSGSRAVVTVLERVETPEIYSEREAADIIASHTGIVRGMNVFNGLPLVEPGDAVTAGETLVSGRMDSLSHPARQIRARAEVWADTWYEQTAVIPEAEREKGEVTQVKRRFALVIGKKRINLFWGSRKELDGYDKIVHEYRVGVKSLFALPLRLVCECYTRPAARPAGTGDPDACAARLREALEQQIEGELVSFSATAAEGEGLLYICARAQCRENIAQTAEWDSP